MRPILQQNTAMHKDKKKEPYCSTHRILPLIFIHYIPSRAGLLFGFGSNSNGSVRLFCLCCRRLLNRSSIL